ncbi:hypothetical protein [Pontibacter rugosus]|uniref:Uncharacterized protein n=1 Tax=Pontibacter rugosus TaxID=1745966 RepID=A0ABW3SRC0_9BACT
MKLILEEEQLQAPSPVFRRGLGRGKFPSSEGSGVGFLISRNYNAYTPA